MGEFNNKPDRDYKGSYEDDWVRYAQIVSDEKHDRGLILSRAFMGDVVDFLYSHKDEALRTLQADGKQRQLVEVLFKNSRDETLKRTEIIPRIDYLGRPVLVSIFEDVARKKQENDVDQLLSRIENHLSLHVSVIVCQGFSEDFSSRFTLSGRGFYSFSRDLTFIGIPKMVESDIEANVYFSSLPPMTDKTIYMVTPDRQKVYKSDIGNPPLRKSAKGTKWDFLGSFKSPRVYNQLFIYGTNDLIKIAE